MAYKTQNNDFIRQKESYNVLGCKRRFASPDKGLRSKTRAGNVGEGGVGMSVAE